VNTKSAKNVLEFATIVRRIPSIVVKVPGHSGRFYFVEVTERTVTCRWSNQGRRQNCPSIGSHSVCYHALSAWEKVYGPVVSWCDNEEAAKKLGNFGNRTIEIRSTQGSGLKVWAVKKGKLANETEQQARIVQIARDYITLHYRAQSGKLVENDLDRLCYCRQQMGILKMTHQGAVRLAKEIVQ